MIETLIYTAVVGFGLLACGYYIGSSRANTAAMFNFNLKINEMLLAMVEDKLVTDAKLKNFLRRKYPPPVAKD